MKRLWPNGWWVLAPAVLIAVFGMVQAGFVLVARHSAPPAPVVVVDGLQASVTAVEQLAHNHDDTAGPYQMPLSMMPGMPADSDVRLAVSLVLTNRSTSGAAIDPATEFALHRVAGGRWSAGSDTFGGLGRLGAHSQVVGTLFFDVPADRADISKLYLKWVHQRQGALLEIPDQGAPAHSHAS